MTTTPGDPADPAPGRPGSFEALADRFGEAAEVAGDARRRLGQLEAGVDDSIWRGAAARSFRTGVAELPGQLARLEESHDTAAGALAGYGATLRVLQDEAAVAIRTSRWAGDDLRWAEQARDAALVALPVAASPIDASETAVAEARRRLLAARQEVEEIAGRRRRAEAVCVGRLELAGEQGVPDERRGLFTLTLRAIGDACDVLAFVLTVAVVVVVAVSVAAALSTTPFGWALLASALATAGPLLTALGWVGAVSVAAKAGRRLAGDRGVTWTGIAVDGALAVVPARAGRLAGAFADADGAAAAAVRAMPVGRLERVGALARGPRLVRAAADRATVTVRVARGRLPLATDRGRVVAAIPDVAVNVVMAALWALRNPRRAAALAAATALAPPATVVAAVGPEARGLLVAWAPVARAAVRVPVP